jgi:phosphohistidine swiveling domain-containing protein
MMALLGLVLASWYTGSNPQIFTDLITGTPVRTATPHENIQLWKMSRTIHASAELTALFEQNPGASFFEALESSPVGREFLADYQSFVAEHGHRGHAERDIYYPRRAEDPSIDYRALGLMLASDPSHDPEGSEAIVNQRRVEAIADVVDNLGGKTMGRLKVDIFRLILDYDTRFLVDRDNERHWLDRSTYTIRRGVLELSRRLVERGALADADEGFFLIREELFDLADGLANEVLTRAKIAGRRQAWDRFARREQAPPAYVHRRRPAAIGQVDLVEGSMQGVGTSRGKVTGTARIVKELKDIGRVSSHEILVVNSTDPGWTPVFLVISGIVLETGGILAHGSCLAREYGFPAVQLPDAMTLIPDGATITIDGDTGAVTIDDVAEPGSLEGDEPADSVLTNA